MQLWFRRFQSHNYDLKDSFCFWLQHKCIFSIMFSHVQRNSSVVHAFDHIYPGTEASSNVVMLYGAIGSNEFIAAHNLIVDIAKQGKAKYVFRHFSPVCREIYLWFINFLVITQFESFKIQSSFSQGIF